MISLEQFQQRLDEYFDGVRRKDFSSYDNVPNHYNYGHLLALFFAIPKLDKGEALFNLFYKYIKTYSRNKVQKKYQAGEKIKVSFLAVSAAEWPSEELYRTLEKDDRFEVNIVGTMWNDRTPETSKKTYEMLKDKFCDGNYNFVDGINKNGEILTWREIGVPDICIHLTPWWSSMTDEHSLPELPISTVNYYIPYGVYVENNATGDYLIECVCNKDFMNAMDTVFMDFEANLEGFKEYQVLHGENVVASGYPKMDFFYDEHIYSEEDIKSMWKIPDKRSSKDIKKIIIAPHYSVGNGNLLDYSTFHKNYYFLYHIAKKYKDISFVFKPHPNLRHSAVAAGLFGSQEDYEEYLSMWNHLPNAKVVDEASYLELFETSDALILDCISFMTEYLYVDKPVLFLTRKEQHRNRFGEEIYKGFYKSDGSDYEGILNFIEKQVIGEEDDMSSIRKEIYEKHLDYKKKTGMKAYEFIFDTIVKMLEGK